MAKGLHLQIHLSNPARRDLTAIAKWSLKEFGEEAALRYKALVRQALLEVAADPERPGSKERPELQAKGIRTYHLSFSRDRVSGQRVTEPRHLLVYRRREDGVIEIVRILHDSRDIQLHLPEQEARPPS